MLTVDVGFHVVSPNPRLIYAIDLGTIANLNSVDGFNKLRSKVGAPTHNKYFRFIKEVWDLWRAGNQHHETIYLDN